MNAVIVWFVAGAVLMLTELFTPAFVIIFFGAGAWAAALVAAIQPGLEQELAAFLIVSLLSLLLLRRHLIKTFQGRRTEAADGTPTFAHAGRQAEVTQSIPAGEVGEISLGGSFWRATSDQAVPLGGLVRVIGPVPDDELLIKVSPLADQCPKSPTAKTSEQEDGSKP